MKKENLLKKGNESLAMGAMWGVGAVVHPCLVCYSVTAGFLVHGVKEKLSDK